MGIWKELQPSLSLGGEKKKTVEVREEKRGEWMILEGWGPPGAKKREPVRKKRKKRSEEPAAQKSPRQRHNDWREGVFEKLEKGWPN